MSICDNPPSEQRTANMMVPPPEEHQHQHQHQMPCSKLEAQYNGHTGSRIVVSSRRARYLGVRLISFLFISSHLAPFSFSCHRLLLPLLLLLLVPAPSTLSASPTKGSEPPSGRPDEDGPPLQPRSMGSMGSMSAPGRPRSSRGSRTTTRPRPGASPTSRNGSGVTSRRGPRSRRRRPCRPYRAGSRPDRSRAWRRLSPGWAGVVMRCGDVACSFLVVDPSFQPAALG